MLGFLLRHGVALLIVGVGVYAWLIRDDLAQRFFDTEEVHQVQPPVARPKALGERNVSRQDVRETRVRPLSEPVAPKPAWPDSIHWPPPQTDKLRADRPAVVPRRPTKEERRRALQEARAVFWKGELQKAESMYLSLTAQFPGDPDILGELGNLYFLQGRVAQYVDAYFQAVLGLIRQRRREEARGLIDVIKEKDDQRAELLRRNLEVK